MPDLTVTNVGRAVARSGDDATTAIDLLAAVEGSLVRVTADAAYDTVAVYETATARGATVVIPPARTANPHLSEYPHEVLFRRRGR